MRITGMFNKGDHVTYTRLFHKDKKLKVSGAEFIRYVRGGDRAVIVLDSKVAEDTVPLTGLTLGGKI